MRPTTRSLTNPGGSPSGRDGWRLAAAGTLVAAMAALGTIPAGCESASTPPVDAAGAAPAPETASWDDRAQDAFHLAFENASAADGGGTPLPPPVSDAEVADVAGGLMLHSRALPQGNASPPPPGRPAAPAEAAPVRRGAASRAFARNDLFLGGGAGGAIEDQAAAQAAQVPIIRGPFDEVWVVARQREAKRPPASAEVPGIGSLCVPVPEGESIPMPLRSSDYLVRVHGPIAETTCIQRFENTFTEAVEAVYVFPLPHRAAVADFVLEVGNRRIRGIVRDRAEAERIYREAKDAGFTASLLREDRPNVFTEKVANLPPSVPVDVELTWFEALGYGAGFHELALPLVVAPRWNACGASDAVLPAAAPIADAVANAAGEDATVVPYLPEGDDGSHRISIAVEIDAGGGIDLGEIESPTHAITVSRPRPRCPTPAEHLPRHLATVTLAEETTVPNRDFVLRWRVAGEVPRASVVASRDADGAAGGHLLLTLYPPEEVADLPRPAIDLAILFDRSGSMNGPKLPAAKQAVRRLLECLGPDDRVLLASFANDVQFAERELAPATPARLADLARWIDGVRAGGGTDLFEGLDAMLFGDRELGEVGRRQVLVILTDGLSGDEGRIVKKAHDQRGVQEIHCLGIGDSTNRFLIDELARAGDGTSGMVLLAESVEGQVDPMVEAIRTAAIVNPAIDFATAGVLDAVPSRLPTLRPGRPVTIAARWEGEGERDLLLSGTVGLNAVEVPIVFTPPSIEIDDADRRALAKVWARATIAEMSEVGRRGEVLATGEAALDGIRRVALEHGLVSPLTSFVAVDANEALETPGTRTIRQAVPVPSDIDPATTIPGVNSLPHPREEIATGG